MSHFYNRKSYTFSETDNMFLNIKKEMSNFLTKEEAELILQRKYAMIDPPPYVDHRKVDYLYEKITDLERKLQSAFTEIDRLKNKKTIQIPDE